MPRTVADVMTRDPITIAPTAPLKEAVQTLAAHRISGLPVVDAAGKLLGVITETDLMWQESGVEVPPYIMILDSVIYLKNPTTFEQELHKSLGQTVDEVMSKRPKTIRPQDPLQTASRFLHADGVQQLPVVDEAGKLVGILTRGDIVRAMAAGLA